MAFNFGQNEGQTCTQTSVQKLCTMSRRRADLSKMMARHTRMSLCAAENAAPALRLSAALATSHMRSMARRLSVFSCRESRSYIALAQANWAIVSQTSMQTLRALANFTVNLFLHMTNNFECIDTASESPRILREYCHLENVVSFWGVVLGDSFLK